jgi:multidrug efflux pump subunit AcrA (membrane-fusion protein)
MLSIYNLREIATVLLFGAAAATIGAVSPSRSADSSAPFGVPVTVARAANACFSDLVRVTGFMVPRWEAVVIPDSEGSRVTDVLAREGDTVALNQELARLTPPPGKTTPVVLRASAAGLVTQVRTAVGAVASPQAPPMFRIAVNNEIELDAEVPSIHVLKLNPGASARVSREDGPDLVGRVRLLSPGIDPKTQMGHVRLSINGDQALRIGMFARASIDARRSCGVAIPRSAIDHLTVQVVNGDIVETRRVRVGLTSDTGVEIIEGLKVGEIVVADAGTSLHDGDRVRAMFPDDLERLRAR